MSLTAQPFYLVLGLGKTGVSCVRYLCRKGVTVRAMDSRSDPPGLAELEDLDIPLYLGNLDISIMRQAKALVVSPGLSIKEPAIAEAIAYGIPILSDLDLFMQEVSCPVIGVTGTNGKGTVTTLLTQMVQNSGKTAYLAGNIGIPVLDFLTAPTPDYYILEISSFQLELSAVLSLETASILNVTRDHFDRYQFWPDYLQAKQRIYETAKWVIWNREDPSTYPPAQEKSMSFGLSEPQKNEWGIRDYRGISYLAFEDQDLLPVDKLQMKGAHQWSNALAALALAYTLDIPISACLKALETFKGLPHRCEWIGERAGVSWYNDSKGSNVAATAAAISGVGTHLTGKIILIMGGLAKGADFKPLRQLVSKHVKFLLLIGQDAPLIAQTLGDLVPTFYMPDLAAAVDFAAEKACRGDAVLLSPACASMDMFENAEERGHIFKTLAQRIVYESDLPSS